MCGIMGYFRLLFVCMYQSPVRDHTMVHDTACQVQCAEKSHAGNPDHTGDSGASAFNRQDKDVKRGYRLACRSL